jgi:predicted DNA-binding transcriptional regulator AlpA
MGHELLVVWYASTPYEGLRGGRPPQGEFPVKRFCPRMISSQLCGQQRRNELDRQDDQYLNPNRQAEPDIIARSATDARVVVEDFPAALRYNQGRYATRRSAGEKFTRYTSQGPKAQKKLLNIHELEEIYGLKHWTIGTLCSQRKIPHIKIGRRVFFDPAAIDAWLQEHVRPVREVHVP